MPLSRSLASWHSIGGSRSPTSTMAKNRTRLTLTRSRRCLQTIGNYNQYIKPDDSRVFFFLQQNRRLETIFSFFTVVWGIWETQEFLGGLIFSNVYCDLYIIVYAASFELKCMWLQGKRRHVYSCH